MALFLNILKIVAIVFVALFALTFTVYIFNLDMKLTAAKGRLHLEPALFPAFNLLIFLQASCQSLP